MKESSRRTSNKRGLFSVLIIGVLLVVVLVALPKAAHVAASLVMTPVAKTVHWFETSAASFPQYLRNRSELLENITDLKNEIATMRADRYATVRLEKENAELRSLLHDTPGTRVVAGVIGRPPALPYDVLLLDRGSAAGIVAGAPVFIGTQTVIGVVRSVTEQAAIVDLVTSPAFASLVYIMGANVYATAEGIGGGQIAVGVPQGVVVTVGDPVILPSVSPGVYGLVEHIETEPTRAQQTVFVSPDIPIQSLRLVTVMTEPIVVPDVRGITANTRVALEAFLPPSRSELPLVSATSSATSTATTSNQSE